MISVVPPEIAVGDRTDHPKGGVVMKDVLVKARQWLTSREVRSFNNGALLLMWLLILLIVIRTARKIGSGDVSQVNDAIKAVIWPLTTWVALFFLRDPIAAFLKGISQRVTRLSAFHVELELSAATATEAKVPAIDELKPGRGVPVGDSGTQIFEQLQATGPADYVIVDLGEGQEWLTSRLFIVAALFEQMRGVRCIALLEGSGANAGKFVGTVSLHALRWTLAHRYPEYELALAKAFTNAVPGDPVNLYPGFLVFRDERGAFDINIARQLTQQFIQSLQLPAGTPPLPGAGSWAKVYDQPEQWERAEWATAASMRQLLGAKLNKSSVEYIGRLANDQAVRQVLARSGPFVAGVAGDKFESLIDRIALLEELGRKTASAAER